MQKKNPYKEVLEEGEDMPMAEHLGRVNNLLGSTVATLCTQELKSLEILANLTAELDGMSEGLDDKYYALRGLVSEYVKVRGDRINSVFIDRETDNATFESAQIVDNQKH